MCRLNLNLLFFVLIREKCKANASELLKRMNKINCVFLDTVYQPEHPKQLKKASVKSSRGVKQSVPSYVLSNVTPLPKMTTWISVQKNFFVEDETVRSFHT